LRGYLKNKRSIEELDEYKQGPLQGIENTKKAQQNKSKKPEKKRERVWFGIGLVVDYFLGE